MNIDDMMGASHQTMTTPEMAAWLAARAGKLTASRMKDVLKIKKDGTPTKERADLIRDLLAERMTGLSVRHYVNPAMEWGLQTEPEAKMAYTQHTGVAIGVAGFYDHPMIDNFGATPDGLLAPDGLIEIKCPTTGTFIEWMMTGKVPDEHVPQMLAQLACTGRKWCEFVAYDPRIKDERKRLFIRRFTPTEFEIRNIEIAAQAFLDELDRAWEELTTS